MNTAPRQLSAPASRLLAALLLLGGAAGCALTSRIPASYYLQRDAIRIAVIPSGNATDFPEASIVFDKAVEEALRQKGFQIVSADQVLTYASARGLSLRDLPKRKASEIGSDLHADMLFFTEIDTWKTSYVLVQAKAHVAGVCRMTDASTDALVCRLRWRQEQASGGGSLGGLINAAVTAVADSAFDKCSRLGEHAAWMSAAALPQPGFAPRDAPP